MKNEKSKNVLIYVAAVGALLMILSYFFVFQKFKTEAETLERSNQELDRRVKELEVYYNNRDQYMQESERIRQEIDGILVEYPADAREEDAIKLAVYMQMQSGLAYSNINISTPESVKVIPAETVTPAEIENYSGQIAFSSRNVSYVNEISYEGLKNAIKTIFENENRMGINNIVYMKNEDGGCLTGSINVTFYSVQGTGKEYTPPDLVQYLSGTDNIFGTFKEPEEDAAETEQGTEEEQATGTEQGTEAEQATGNE